MQPDEPTRGSAPLTYGTVLRTWLPLAGSWILMGLELPMISAVMARLVDPRISLAAYGGVVFPLALIVEAPVIMLLAASTALAKDEPSYRLLHRFMVVVGAGLTAIHLAIAATPLYDLVVAGLIGAPEEIRGPARIGMLLMTPWTWTIAYRRLQQGVLIRYERSHQVGIGTVVRLASNATVLAIGVLLGSLPGIAVGTAAVAAGVSAEAYYSYRAVRPILRNRLPLQPRVDPPLTLSRFLHFYIPLAMTSLLTLLSLPIGSAAVSRMPRAIDSLAVWPVLNGLTFTMRSLGLAFNEVVVALLDRTGAARVLRRFAWLMSGATSGTLLLIAATPLAGLYFSGISGLPPELALLAGQGLWISVWMPALGFQQHLRQGVLVHVHRTRAITEAVAVYLLTSASVLAAGILLDRFTGLFVALIGTVVGNAAQVGWLWFRSRPVFADLTRASGSAPLPARPRLRDLPYR
ncbi:MAG: hypothetical protein GF346_12580 [Candidatus Eisenbacteria bacterium]|nr:hypothetical protein [Candidatus Latescibacterota bacterium]MBD3303272.1 hypothetical protein [Candidatus Eisenbacteria bacterium]